MRIAVVTDQYLPMVGGVAATTHQLASRLAARDHHVSVIAPSEGWHNEHHMDGQVSVYRFSSFEWPAYEGQRVAWLPFLGLQRLFKKLHPEVRSEERRVGKE